jgi:hypothetical protein
MGEVHFHVTMRVRGLASQPAAERGARTWLSDHLPLLRPEAPPMWGRVLGRGLLPMRLLVRPASASRPGERFAAVLLALDDATLAPGDVPPHWLVERLNGAAPAGSVVEMVEVSRAVAPARPMQFA